ncbi:type III polyketide synthase [Actinacidiphila sp. ITFR-21]|uniref:type III polyketide synthase n=1 Tax=Actinacidiphila sp. ITFR-21 TaxID=3075199 RepID=UPI00288954E2|nr:3-oxoacyl-[acyl-carrier-protein] synthase III C-terminal domain-containing protein [Streptomyces sp. ITFR-21]WNI19443.1 3-oxoacyl-[acyl-carrier-protein] synthase III C-terminal domain-containing protein [Streptomyces sp. ITFR-21]
MTRIAAVHGVLPPHRYEQHEITDALAAMGMVRGAGRAVLDRVHDGSTVRTRRLALPLERYAELSGFGQANDSFIEVALELGEQAVRGALDEAGLRARDVDLVISTSVTGIAAPSIEARLAGRLGLREDVKRVPIFGLGCVAGAAGLARLHDYLDARPDGVAVLLSVELCSLTLQRADASAANLVAGALFGDGAAAVVAVGRDRPGGRPDEGPRVVATRSRLYPGTERLLGWDIGDRGFQIVLGGDLPDLVRSHLGSDVRAFLADHDLKPQDVTAWVCHPGGPRILEAVRETLDLPARALELAWRSLAEVGNLSSASVLHVLRDTLALRPPLPGSAGLLLAMGPGFCSELVLLRW